MSNVRSALIIAASFVRTGNRMMARSYLHCALIQARELPDNRRNRLIRAYIVQAIGAL